MKCSSCGGFYNEQCPHWPKCQPDDTPIQYEYVPTGSELSFRIALLTFLGMIAGALGAIYLRMP